MSNNYSFDVVPPGTLRVTISQLNDEYAIARLLDISEVPDDFKPQTIARFVNAIKDMGFTVLGFNDKSLKIKPNVPDYCIGELAKVKPPALLLKQVELEYDPDRF